MACQDDIFCIQALIEKHGDSDDKKAWQDHMDLFNELEAQAHLGNKLRSAIARVGNIISGKEEPYD